MPKNDQVGQMIIVIALVSSGSIQTLQANLIASILYLTIVIIPLCFWLYLQNGIEYFALLFILVAYYLFIIISAVRANYDLTRSLRSQLTNLVLLEEVSESNSDLKYKNFLLHQHEHDMTIINKMNKTLQLCRNSVEAYPAIKNAAQILFNDYNGGLTITDPLNNQQLTAQWGNSHTLKPIFASTECWALRSGKQHKVMDQQMDLICEHYIGLPIAHSICFPLILHNTVLGMLNFNMTDQVMQTKHTKQMMTVFADAIKFALANIMLYEKLEMKASHDPLTNLYNRRYLNELLARELQLISRNKSSLCVAMLDIDYL